MSLRGLLYLRHCARFHSTAVTNSLGSGKEVKFTFINRDGSKTLVEAEIGKSVLEAAHENNVELEGACEGAMACSTCHVILDPELFDKLEEPCERESRENPRAEHAQHQGAAVGGGHSETTAFQRAQTATRKCQTQKKDTQIRSKARAHAKEPT